MDAGEEAAVCGDALQQCDEPGHVGFVECDEQFRVVFVGRVLSPGE